MAKIKLAARDARTGGFLPASTRNELQTFTVRSSQAGLALSRNPHSSERDRVQFSEQFVEDSLAHTNKRLSNLKSKK
tara:strand:+ start:1103 stop:1333 length:231 start_codon:yes stop_codon:yes gene_type:complete